MKNHPLKTFLLRLVLFIAAGAGLKMIYSGIPSVKIFVVNSWFIDTFYRMLMGPVSFLLSVTGVPHNIGYSEQAVQYFVRLHETGNMLFLWIPCLGLSLIYIFMALVLSFPGPLKMKVYYCLAGIFVIETLNILRLYILSVLLADYEAASPTHSKITSWLTVSHETVFNYTIIGLIFLFFVFVTNRLIKSTK